MNLFFKDDLNKLAAIIFLVSGINSIYNFQNIFSLNSKDDLSTQRNVASVSTPSNNQNNIANTNNTSLSQSTATPPPVSNTTGVASATNQAVLNAMKAVAQNANVTVKIKPKIKGSWIVDANLGDDSDTDKINTAMLNAEDGDVIKIKAGVYTEQFTFSKSVTLVGESAESVFLVDSTNQGNSILDKIIEFKNLSFEMASAQNSTDENFLLIKGSDISFTNSNIKAIPFAIKNSNLNLASSKVFDYSKTAFHLIESKVKVSKTQFSKMEESALTLFQNSNLEISEAEFIKIKKMGILLSETSAKIENLKSKDTEYFLIADKNSKININKLNIENVKIGIVLNDNSHLNLTDGFIRNASESDISINTSFANVENSIFADSNKGLTLKNSLLYINKLKTDSVTTPLYCFKMPTVYGSSATVNKSKIESFRLEILNSRFDFKTNDNCDYSILTNEPKRN